MLPKKSLLINRHLFYETTHSPSLVDIVGPEALKDVVDFCFIANPYYPDEALMKLLQEQLPVLIKSYPSSNSKVAQQNLSEVLHVAPESLVIGNGATELIALIVQNLIDEIAIPVPTFGEYIDKLRNDESAKLFQLPADKQYQLNLSDYADWIDQHKISSALIINPGNPTGQVFSLSEMEAFLNRMSYLQLIIVDESFIDFADEIIPSLLPQIDKFKNLMVIRSMSKHCGIPGLRLGYSCSSNLEFQQSLRKFLPVWNINTLAEFFLSQLKETDEQYHVARLKVIADIRFLYQQLKEIECIEVYPTGSNFVMIKLTCGITASEMQLLLLEKYHAYVRDCSNKAGLDNYHIRVASQGREKDQILVDALKEITKG